MFHFFFFTELNSRKVKSLETELNEMTNAYKQIMDDLLEKVDEIETYVLSRTLSFFSSLTYSLIYSLTGRNAELHSKYKTMKVKCDVIERKRIEMERSLRSEMKNQQNDLEKLKKENESYRRRIQQMRYNQLAKKAVQSESKVTFSTSTSTSTSSKSSNKKRVYSEVVTVTPPKKKFKNRMKRTATPSPGRRRTKRKEREIESNEASPAIIRTTLTTPGIENSKKEVARRVVKSAPALRRPRSRNNNTTTTPATYKYTSVVRGKEARSKLKGRKCKECEAFLQVMESALGSENARELCQSCSRHRHEFTPENTPDGFWKLGFADSMPAGESFPLGKRV